VVRPTAAAPAREKGAFDVFCQLVILAVVLDAVAAAAILTYLPGLLSSCRWQDDSWGSNQLLLLLMLFTHQDFAKLTPQLVLTALGCGFIGLRGAAGNLSDGVN
jgi:hypothetical protein